MNFFAWLGEGIEGRPADNHGGQEMRCYHAQVIPPHRDDGKVLAH